MLRIALIGLGNVGKAFVKVLLAKAGELAKLGYEPCVVGALASRGGVVGDGCLSNKLLAELADKGLYGATEVRSIELGDLISLNPDVAVVAIPPSYRTGEPNLSMYRELVRNRVSVVTADKTGLALAYQELVGEARARGVYLGFTATVMAGTPALPLLRGLRGRSIDSITGVLNATSNYVLTLVEGGLPMIDAVKRAVEEKIAEPDPSIDLGGLDAAAKAVIMANTVGLPVSLRNVEVQSLLNLNEAYIRDAVRRGVRVKQVASIDLAKGRVSVKPMEVLASGVLGSVSGNYNALIIRLKNGNEITLIGPTGPAGATAEVMFSDLLEYVELRLMMGKG